MKLGFTTDDYKRAIKSVLIIIGICSMYVFAIYLISEDGLLDSYLSDGIFLWVYNISYFILIILFSFGIIFYRKRLKFIYSLMSFILLVITMVTYII